MPFTTVRDLRLYYEIHGTGPRLMVISGTGGDLRRKPNIFDSPLARHFEVLSYDQRGQGQTSCPDIVYTMADYADDANGLLDAAGWDRCLVMGISFGGMVAQEFTLRYPHRVERLVLACTSSGGIGGASLPVHEMTALSIEEYTHQIVELGDIRRDANWKKANPEKFQKLFDQTLAEVKERKNDSRLQMGSRRQLEARSGHDTYERLSSLNLPVYICGGKYDGVAPPANLETMQKQIPGARLELFEGGHLFFIQDKKAFAKIEAFLKGELDD